jgi:hypothetical protein
MANFRSHLILQINLISVLKTPSFVDVKEHKVENLTLGQLTMDTDFSLDCFTKGLDLSLNLNLTGMKFDLILIETLLLYHTMIQHAYVERSSKLRTITVQDPNQRVLNVE